MSKKNNHVWTAIQCRHPEMVQRAYPHPNDSQVTMSARHCTKCSYRDNIKWNGMSWQAYKISLGLGEPIGVIGFNARRDEDLVTIAEIDKDHDTA